MRKVLGNVHDGDRCEGLASDTLTDWVRIRFRVLVDPVAQRLSRLGVHPNTVSVAGFLLQTLVGVLFLTGWTRWGGVLLLVVAPLDALDGAVARAGGLNRPFGAFLDSTLDRLADAILILGLAAHQMRQAAMLEVWLLLAALVVAFMVSYTRARAASLGATCKVGLLTRLERVSLIAALTTLGWTTILAWTLAALSIVTLFQRVFHIYSQLEDRE